MQSLIALFKSLWQKFISLFRKKKDDDINEDPVIDRPPDDIVCYYGCPNSDKAKKLQTGRKAYR